jgi:quercetin 2,3-dioxygenase
MFPPHSADDGTLAGFGPLELLNEAWLAPSSALTSHSQRDTEIVTYVLDGALAYEDSLGRSGVLTAGEFRCMTATRGVDFRQANPSRIDQTHFLEIGLRADGEVPASEGRRRFTMAERRDTLCLVAAAAPGGAALGLRQDVRVYSALLRAGQHLVHALLPERSAWLQVVAGELAFDASILAAGEGVGVMAARSLSFTARTDAEVLLVDLA